MHSEYCWRDCCEQSKHLFTDSHHHNCANTCYGEPRKAGFLDVPKLGGIKCSGKYQAVLDGWWRRWWWWWKGTCLCMKASINIANKETVIMLQDTEDIRRMDLHKIFAMVVMYNGTL